MDKILLAGVYNFLIHSYISILSLKKSAKLQTNKSPTPNFSGSYSSGYATTPYLPPSSTPKNALTPLSALVPNARLGSTNTHS
jgi:hypothetical protein